MCGAPNQCAMEIQRVTGVTQPPCWCTQVTFPPSLLERVPTPAWGHACICQACARA
ncbi:MAG: cysteine-rich CWC family protein [Gammaproteobacteria bacterium]